MTFVIRLGADVIRVISGVLVVVSCHVGVEGEQLATAQLIAEEVAK